VAPTCDENNGKISQAEFRGVLRAGSLPGFADVSTEEMNELFSGQGGW